MKRWQQWCFIFVLSISTVQSMANVLSAGSGHSCAIQPDDRVICWGNAWSIKAPNEKFIDISVGRSYTCGVLTNNTVNCWGSGGDGQTTPPQGAFTQVSAALSHTCGLRTDNTVACWGRDPDEDYGQANPPSDTFQQISAGGWHTCGVKTDGMAACWGLNENPFSVKEVIGEGQATPPAGVVFTQVSAGLGGWHTCGIRADNHQVQCWGLNDDGQAAPAKGKFSQISAGKYFTCGVRFDNTLACWGWSDFGQVHIPESDCEQLFDNLPRYECTTTAEDNKYISVAAGLIHTCAMKIDRSVVCWGKNDKNQASPPMNLLVKDVSELVQLKLAIKLNQTTYQRGEQFIFELDVSGGRIEQLYDLYTALIFPQNYFLTIIDEMNFSELNEVKSYKTDLDLSHQQTFPILDITIPNEIEIGDYQACGVITNAHVSQPENEQNWLTFVCKPFLLQ